MADLVVMYHGVIPDDFPCDDWLQVPARRFREQLAALLRLFEPVTPDQLFTPRARWQRPRLLVTFDDGYANNLQTALPILRALGVPALFFLATGYLGTPWFWWDRLREGLARVGQQVTPAMIAELKALRPDAVEPRVSELLTAAGADPHPAPVEALRPLTWEEAKRLAVTPDCAIGNHGHHHEIFLHLDPAALSKVLATSQTLLRDRIGYLPRWIAPPNGDWRADQTAIIREAGFAALFTTQPGWVTPQIRGSDLPLVPRIGIGAGDTPWRIAKRLIKYRFVTNLPAPRAANR